MELTYKRNIILENAETKPFLADAIYPNSEQKLPLVVFVHGYKGYKDWGTWDLVADKLAKAGLYFVKFNFSHNGTTLQNPFEFDDLESFGQNNYTKELSDLKVVIDFFSQQKEVDASRIILIGHSRGGGISILKTFEDPRITDLATWASVDTTNRFPKGETFENWKRDGIYYILNGRTNQKMPHYWQFFEDYEKNIERLNIQKAMSSLKAKTLIIHGTNDEAVSEKAAFQLKEWNPSAELFLVENAGHTFGGKEPWQEEVLPKDLDLVVEKTIHFIQSL